MLIKPHEIQTVSNMVMNMLHEDEIEIANSFYESAKSNDIEKTNELLDVFMYDVEDHFSTEEAMMEESKFYAAQIHKAEHDTLREKVKKLKEHWDAHQDTQEIVRFLKEDFKPWMMLHVARWDSETAMHLGDNA